MPKRDVIKDFTRTWKGLKRKTIFRLFLFFIPSGIIGNVALSISLTSWKSFDRIFFQTIHVAYVPLAVVLALLPWIFHSMRICLWTDFVGTHLSLRDALYIVLGDELGSSLTPTAIGGGYVKLGLLIERDIKPGIAASLTTIGTLEDAVFFGIIIPVLIFFTALPDTTVHHCAEIFSAFTHRSLVFGTIAVIIIVALAVLFVCTGKKRLTGLVNACKDFRYTCHLVYRKGKVRFGCGVVLTALQWGCRYSVVTALIAFFGLTVHPLHFFLFQWLVFILTILVPTPGGAVGAEASFYYIFQLFVPGDIMGLLTGLWRFLTYYLQMILGALLFTMSNARKLTARQ